MADKVLGTAESNETYHDSHEVYECLVNPDREKHVRVYIKKETYTASGSGESYLRDIDRDNPNIIEMTIEGNADFKNESDIKPSFDNPLPIISKVIKGQEICSLGNYHDTLYDDTKETRIFHGTFGSDDNWALESDEGDYCVFSIKNNVDATKLDYEIEFELGADGFSTNLPLENSPVLCTHAENVNEDGREGIWIDENSNLSLRIRKDRLSTIDSDGIRAYLTSVDEVGYIYVLKYQKNAYMSINLVTGEDVNILFDCDADIDPRNLQIEGHDTEFETFDEETYYDYRTFPVHL